MGEEPRSQRPLEELEAVLGHRFADRELLSRALRHASYCNEHARDGALALGDNQRLEFLGDAVLALTVSQRLMTRFPEAHEGELSVTRAQVVSEDGLSEVARQIALGEWLALGRGEERSGGRDKSSILADTFEALVAAVFLDGGLAAADDVVGRLLVERIQTAEIRNLLDHKTRLQEAAQAELKATPTYRVVDELGPEHDKRFVVAVTIADKEWARATGRSKKEAERLAAAEAHRQLQQRVGQDG